MSRKKLKVHQTDLDVLVAHLRGEVGEIIVTWALLRSFMWQAQSQTSDDIRVDIENESLRTLNIVIDKFSDEIVARLAELGEQRIGRLTFHFAAEKLGRLQEEARAYSKLMRRERFKEKRDRDISHKEAPQKWSDSKYLTIPYTKILRGIAAALRLMKKIDRVVLGPSAPLLWHKMRERRYTPMTPPRALYFILPHLGLSAEERQKIILEEISEGYEVWEPMETTIDGTAASVPVCRKWGAFVLDGRVMVLDQYPLNELTGIETNPRIKGEAVEGSK